MKKLYFMFLIISTILLLFFQCSPEQREHLNPFDPEYTGTSTGDTSGSGSGTSPTYHTGIITFNSNSYTGTNSSALITLTDADLTDSTVNVNVKSSSDSTGITLVLSGTSPTYTGTLNFTLGTSTGNKIKVAQGDTITVTYNDAEPSGIRTDTANWITNGSLGTTNYYWIYSDVHTQDFKYDQSNPPIDYGGKLGVWGSCGIADDNTDVPTGGGSKSLKISYTGAGGCFWIYCDSSWNPTNENLSAFQNGKLIFWVKSSVNIEIKIEDSSSGVSKYLTDYITPNGTWQQVVAPLSDFSALNWTKIKTVIGFHYTSSATVYVDEVHFTDK